MNGIIYLVKNKGNQRCYIGQTIQKWPIRKNQHINSPNKSSILDKAIQKYGKDVFEWTILESNIKNQKRLNFLEKFHIVHHSTNIKKGGYNIREGGSNGKHSETSKEKLREYRLGKKASEETRLKMSKKRKGENNPNYGNRGPKNPMFGTKHSQEQKEEQSKRFSGKNNPMYGLRGKNNPNYGSKRSPETCKNISKSLSGENSPNWGKKVPKELIVKQLKSKQKKEFVGACFLKHVNPEKKCWRSLIQFNGFIKYLGFFHDPLSASLMYQLVFNELYGDIL